MRGLVLRRDERALGADQLPLLAGEPLLGAGGQLLRVAGVAGRERRGQGAALPEVVVVDLGDRRAEAVLELRLRRLHVLALSLQRARLREVEFDGEDPDVPAAQVAAAGAGGSLRSVRSSWRTS